MCLYLLQIMVIITETMRIMYCIRIVHTATAVRPTVQYANIIHIIIPTVHNAMMPTGQAHIKYVDTG